MNATGGLPSAPYSRVVLQITSSFSASSPGGFNPTLSLSPLRLRPRLRVSCSLESSNSKKTPFQVSPLKSIPLSELQPVTQMLNFELRSPSVPANLIAVPKWNLSDQAFLLLAFTSCTVSLAFTSLVVAAIPTLFAMRRAAISLSRLTDTAREELPSTMAAIRLSGMEISDLTLELSDLSQEIADGVSKSAQAVQAAEAGIRQIGSLARQQTMSMIQERANLPIISLQPVVAGAAKRTTRAVSHATKSLFNIISRSEHDSADENEHSTDVIES